MMCFCIFISGLLLLNTVREGGNFSKDFIYLFLERKERREEERERNINVLLPFMHPLLGTWPTTQA